MTLTGEHPEITFRTDALLRSINDRLGALAAGHGVGQDIPPLERTYLAELLEFAIANHEDLEADYEERVSEMRHSGERSIWEMGTDG